MKRQVELVLDEKSLLGEGPSWDKSKNVLWWVDILGKKVHMFDPESNENQTIYLNQYVGAVVPKRSEGLMLALQNGFYSMDLPSETLSFITDPEESKPNNRFNDGKCDAFGRFWAGTMSLDDEKGAGSLYCFDKNHTVRTKVEHVTVSNGITWSPDHQTMYYTDTPTNQIVAYDFNIESGEISHKRVVVNIPKSMGSPDGMTIDDEGMLWVAKWGGYQVGRWNPQTGELIESISIPSPLVTSCSFGGENLDELYITTARIGLDKETLEKYPHAGGLFKVPLNVKGIEMYPFDE